MITIKFESNPEECCLEAKGHACSADMGRDLVCAAVSILVQTLDANLEFFGGYTGRLSEGDAYLHCRMDGVDTQADHDIRVIYGAIYVGLCALAESCPEYIKMVG